MSVIGLILFVFGIVALFAISYGSYKLYKSALLDDEIAEQEELAKQAEKARAYAARRTKKNVEDDQEALKEILTRRK